MMRTTHKLLALGGLGALLGACGGGGDGGSPVTTVQGSAPISTSSAAAASADGAGLALSGGGFGGLIYTGPYLVATATTTTPLPQYNVKLPDLAKRLAAYVDELPAPETDTGGAVVLAAGLTISAAPAATSTKEYACDAGKYTVSKSGSKATITFSNCKYVFSQDLSQVENGVVIIETLAANSHKYQLQDYTLAYNDEYQAKSNGSLTYTTGNTSESLSIPKLTWNTQIKNEQGKIEYNVTRVLSDFSRILYFNTADYYVKSKGRVEVTGDLSYDISFDNTAISTDQSYFYIKNDAYFPYMGKLLVKDNKNSSTKLVITALSDGQSYVVTPTINGEKLGDKTFQWLPD